MSETRKHVIIYTDGGCEPNPGAGGYGVVLIYGEHRKQASGGFRQTTNNRMEIMAAIKGLEMLKEPCDVTLFSDSEYLVNAMRKGWARRWKANGWKRRKNPDLWKHLLVLCDKHAVTFEWVKGHAGQPENELCDQLSMKALRQPDLPPDDGYVPSSPVQNAGAVPQTPEATTQHRPEKSKPIDGGPCPKCGTRLERRTPKSKPKESQSYYFEYYLYCPGCSRMFMVEEAKRNIDRPGLFE